MDSADHLRQQLALAKLLLQLLPPAVPDPLRQAALDGLTQALDSLKQDATDSHQNAAGAARDKRQ